MHERIFATRESTVRSYCRRLPQLFVSARGAQVVDDRGEEYIDFLSACGALNYGHNHPHLKSAAMSFLSEDGMAAALDLHTTAKLSFVRKFDEVILRPRGMDYVLQFPGPTGTNCVEAALKLARKVTGRNGIAAFTNGFHGVSAGSLAATASQFVRNSAGNAFAPAVRLPFEGYHGAGIEDLERFEAMALDPSGGIEPIAAIIVETVQGEGGLNVASAEWLRALAVCAENLGALLIVDDIQAGCGRTGPFFSFERAGVKPDLVCMAKSISGYGFPMSLLLIAPQHDKWAPGEHNGTFRGNSIAFATAAAAIDFWSRDIERDIALRSDYLRTWCDEVCREFPSAVRRKGIGMMQGLQFAEPRCAVEAADRAALRGVMIECCGPRDEVLKIFAPVNIPPDLFASGLGRLRLAIREALHAGGPAAETVAPSDPNAAVATMRLERDEASLDPHDDGGDPVGRAELSHRIA